MSRLMRRINSSCSINGSLLLSVNRCPGLFQFEDGHSRRDEAAARDLCCTQPWRPPHGSCLLRSTRSGIADSRSGPESMVGPFNR
jgi:hypothetical protein